MDTQHAYMNAYTDDCIEVDRHSRIHKATLTPTDQPTSLPACLPIHPSANLTRPTGQTHPAFTLI